MVLHHHSKLTASCASPPCWVRTFLGAAQSFGLPIPRCSQRVQPRQADCCPCAPEIVVAQHLVLDGGSLEAEVQAMQGTERSVVQPHHTDSLFQESLVDYLYCGGSVPLLLTDNEQQPTPNLRSRPFGAPVSRTALTTASRAQRRGECGIDPRLRCKKNRLCRAVKKIVCIGRDAEL